MRASYDSIDNKQKMCEKVNKDITFIQFFHSTELFKIFISLLTLQLLFCKKLVGREKSLDAKSIIEGKIIISIMSNNYYFIFLLTKNFSIHMYYGLCNIPLTNIQIL